MPNRKPLIMLNYHPSPSTPDLTPFARFRAGLLQIREPRSQNRWLPVCSAAGLATFLEDPAASALLALQDVPGARALHFLYNTAPTFYPWIAAFQGLNPEREIITDWKRFHRLARLDEYPAPSLRNVGSLCEEGEIDLFGYTITRPAPQPPLPQMCFVSDLYLCFLRISDLRALAAAVAS